MVVDIVSICVIVVVHIIGVDVMCFAIVVIVLVVVVGVVEAVHLMVSCRGICIWLLFYESLLVGLLLLLSGIGW